MKLEKLAAIAEIVSSLAIVVTLAFLTMQTREMARQTEQTNTALFASSRATTMTADVNLLLAGYDPSGNDRGRFVAAFFRIREFAWFQYQSGILEQAAWESYVAPVANGMLDNPEVLLWWEANSSQLAPGFVAAINHAAGRE
jgi:hypothetical protein